VQQPTSTVGVGVDQNPFPKKWARDFLWPLISEVENGPKLPKLENLRLMVQPSLPSPQGLK